MTDTEEYLSLLSDERGPDKARILRARHLAHRLAERSGAGPAVLKDLNQSYLSLQFAVIAADPDLIAASRQRCVRLVRGIGAPAG